MYQPILVTEGLAVVTLASVLAVGAGVVEALVLVVEALVLEVGALVVEAGVVEALVVEAGVVEALVLVVEALVLEVAVEAIVVEGLGVVTAVATVGSSTKESTKEPCARLILARSLPSFSSTGVTLALLGPIEGTLDGWAENGCTQGTQTQPNNASVQCLVAGQGRSVTSKEKLLIYVCHSR